MSNTDFTQGFLRPMDGTSYLLRPPWEVSPIRHAQYPLQFTQELGLLPVHQLSERAPSCSSTSSLRETGSVRVHFPGTGHLIINIRNRRLGFISVSPSYVHKLFKVLGF